MDSGLTKKDRSRWWIALLMLAGAVLLGALLWKLYLAQEPSWGATRQFPFENDHTRVRESRIASAPQAPAGELSLGAFYALQTNDVAAFESAADTLREGWRNGYAPILLEITRFTPSPSHRSRMVALVEELTGEVFHGDLDAAWRWVWSEAYEPHPQYSLFKAELYRLIDPDFVAYFDDDTAGATVRLDEIRWGGVERDGISPLVNPGMVAADSPGADYLEDDNIVFGIAINGDARAYPKRILAWHEMFKDTVGGVSVNGVYCTLCGSMILYNTVYNGTHHELGTSGFLYRSNKVMYDHETESMWSTITGEPTVGPLVGQGIKLEPLYVVTTTWGEWRRRHPETSVLSLNTGYDRDYGEGVAYRTYFSTDRLMFSVPQTDRRLANKAEVLALRFGDVEAPPVAIDTTFLVEHPVYQNQLGEKRYVIFTDPSGGNRVYDAGAVDFTAYDGAASAVSADGREWVVAEAGLVAGDGFSLPRLAAHRVFWFGWHAAHPDTVLIGPSGD